MCTGIDFRQVLDGDCLRLLYYVLAVISLTAQSLIYTDKVESGHNQHNDPDILLFIFSLYFSLTSLFYGEPSEKEKSPSESSPSDSETKDMVSFQFESFISS